MPQADAYLVVFNTVPPESQAEFHAWYQTEHLDERLSVPGFETGRRYRSALDDNRFVAIYTLREVAVSVSPAYRERLENPTPRTRKAMRNFNDMSRTFMEPVVEQRGGITAEASFLFLEHGAHGDPAEAAAGFRAAMDAMRRTVGLVEGFSLLRGQLADGNKTTRESALRPGADTSAQWVAVVEWSSTPQDAALRASLMEQGFFIQDFPSGIYRLICARVATR